MRNPPAMPQLIEANGLESRYHSAGAGPVMLFLYGFLIKPPGGHFLHRGDPDLFLDELLGVLAA